MITYAVVDTNVMVSALLSSNDNAATVRLIGKLFAGEIIPLYSNEILDEYHDVLNRDKFNFPVSRIDGMLAAIEKYGFRVSAVSSGIILPDMKDLPFYDVALKRQDVRAYLVTGNIKHFPNESFIVTAAQMMDILSVAR